MRKQFFCCECGITINRGGLKCRSCMGKSQKGKNNPNWKGGGIKRICQVCEKEFRIIPFRLKRGDGKYCSRKCYRTVTGKRQKGNCRTCGKEMLILVSRIKDGRGKFCSASCRSIWTKKHWGNKQTSIELKVEKYLTQLGISFESQKVIPEGRTIADFYIPEQHLVLYADGKYWHNKPGAKNKDCRQDFLLGMNGFKVLRLGEDEINLKAKDCLKKIKRSANAVGN